MSYRYITLFDENGIETIVDITLDNHAILDAIIHNEKNPEQVIYDKINNIMLRARLNSQRKTEVWIFWSDADEHMLSLAKDELIDIIQEKGHKLY